ncbi:hypothetical protein C3R21_13080, partial [Mycobacterium tuberculosis]
ILSKNWSLRTCRGGSHPVRQLPKVAKCVPNVVLGFLNEGLPYRVPYPQTTPVQESGPARPIPSGIC